MVVETAERDKASTKRNNPVSTPWLSRKKLATNQVWNNQVCGLPKTMCRIYFDAWSVSLANPLLRSNSWLNKGTSHYLICLAQSIVADFCSNTAMSQTVQEAFFLLFDECEHGLEERKTQLERWLSGVDKVTSCWWCQITAKAVFLFIVRMAEAPSKTSPLQTSCYLADENSPPKSPCSKMRLGNRTFVKICYHYYYYYHHHYYRWCAFSAFSQAQPIMTLQLVGVVSGLCTCLFASRSLTTLTPFIKGVRAHHLS